MGLNIVWLGELGFPYGLAAAQRARLIFKGLMEHGICGTVINTYGIYDSNAELNIKVEGEFEKIKYIHASGSPYRSKNFIVRNIRKLWGVINEIHILYALNKKKEIYAAILETGKFKAIVFYRVLSWLVGFPLIMNYVEMVSSVSTKRGGRHRVGSYLYEKFGFFLVDGIMPISDFLVDLVKRCNPRLPLLKVPIITDFDRFRGIERGIENKYFLYCGAAAYMEIIIFILKAFEQLDTSEEVRLYLVVNGSPLEMKRLNEEIANNEKGNLIKIYSGITDNQLTELYANARGLLIPLRPTNQDRARFPHKFGEYLASGNPVVTTNYGEVISYFEDEKTALIAERYDIAEYSEKMKYIILNPEKAKEIGQKGRQMCLNNFDYKIYGPKIKEFIDSIISREQN